MTCPYCGKDMSEGYIFNGNQPNQWLPNGAMPARLIFTSSKKGIDLKNRLSVFREGGYCAEAYHCDQCHVVIAPTR